MYEIFGIVKVKVYIMRHDFYDFEIYEIVPRGW